MCFEDVVEGLGRAFSLELTVVQGTTVFEAASKDSGTKVQMLVQNAGVGREIRVPRPFPAIFA